jgi:hypothetical protein
MCYPFGQYFLWEKGTPSPFPSITMSILSPIPAKLWKSLLCLCWQQGLTSRITSCQSDWTACQRDAPRPSSFVIGKWLTDARKIQYLNTASKKWWLVLSCPEMRKLKIESERVGQRQISPEAKRSTSREPWWRMFCKRWCRLWKEWCAEWKFCGILATRIEVKRTPYHKNFRNDFPRLSVIVSCEVEGLA